jgi:arylsulfatase A-like enzyme
MEPGKEHMLKILKKNGYTTGLAGKNHCFKREDLGYFDFIEESGHRGPETQDPYYLEPIEHLRSCADIKGCWGHTKNPFPPERLGTHWTTDRAIDFVTENRNHPFFLWFSIPDPHVPFQAPEPYASMYPPETVDMPEFREHEMENKPAAQQIDSKVMCADTVTEPTIREVRSIYYGMNTYIDDELGRFFDLLGSSGLYENTLIVYVSDHGEYLGEHKMIRKSKSAYDCLTHIPFIVYSPEVRPFRSNEFVSLEDIMPTVLNAAKIPVPREVQGRDLTPLLCGGRLENSRPFAWGEYGGRNEPVDETAEIAACETPLSHDFSPGMKLGGFGKMRYIRTENWKLVCYVNDTYELYNVEDDPYELENLFTQEGYEQIKIKLMSMLAEHMMRMNNPDISSTRVS